jgi:hypothetical protein
MARKSIIAAAALGGLDSCKLVAQRFRLLTVIGHRPVDGGGR